MERIERDLAAVLRGKDEDPLFLPPGAVDSEDLASLIRIEIELPGPEEDESDPRGGDEKHEGESVLRLDLLPLERLELLRAHLRRRRRLLNGLVKRRGLGIRIGDESVIAEPPAHTGEKQRDEAVTFGEIGIEFELFHG